MRKTFLVLLAMTMVATMAFAQTQVEYELSGEATATFGVNLDGDATKDDAMTGFRVSSDADLDITFVEETTEEFGEGDVYGWMEIEDFKFEVDDAGISGASGDVSAKVFLGPAYIVVATADTEVNEAEFGLNVDESIIGAPAAVGDLARAQSFNTGDGAVDTDNNVVAVGFMVPELLTVELALSSQGDWTENKYNNYAGGIYTEATVAGFTIELDAVATLRGHTGPVNDSESAGDFGDNSYIGLGVGYDVPLNDMLTLTPYFGMDIFNDTAGDELDFEVIAGANVGWGGADDMEVFGAVSDETEAGFGVEVGYKTLGDNGDQDWLWVRLGVAEESGDDGFFPVIGAAALVEFAQGTSDTNVDGTLLGFGAELDADLGVVSPFFGLMYADVEDSSGNDAGLTLNLGTDINVVSATTFTVEYASGDLMNDADASVTALDGTYDYASARGASTSNLGTFTISTKVEY